jgi:hypothetical protein
LDGNELQAYNDEGCTSKKKSAPTKKAATAKAKKPADKKPAALKKAKAAPGINSIDYWKGFPLVTSKLTVGQLCYELLHRNPHSKVGSHKTKGWYMETLGEGSIWTTSPGMSASMTTAISEQPRITSMINIARLTHELLSRRNSSAITGLSKKAKPELLQMLGEESIWATAHMH